MKKLIASLMILIGSLTIGIGSASAAKPTSGTISIAPGSDLRLGGIASFNVVSNGIKNPLVLVECFQGSTEVYAEIRTVAQQPFTLGGSISPWTIAGGPANCKATLEWITFHPNEVINQVDSVAFAAAG